MTMDIEPQNIIPSDTNEQPSPVFEDFEAFAGGEAQSGTEGLDAVHDVPVRVQAVLGRARMPVGELLHLTSGTVVELDRRVGEPVDIFVNDRLIARGEVVLIDNALGVTLTEITRVER
jgi:flagellar motor switch protein FliN/FliY